MKKVQKQIMAILMVVSLATFSCKKESLNDELPNQVEQNSLIVNDSTHVNRDILNRDILNRDSSNTQHNHNLKDSSNVNQIQKDSNFVVIKDTNNIQRDTISRVINGDGLKGDIAYINLMQNQNDTTKKVINVGDSLQTKALKVKL